MTMNPNLRTSRQKEEGDWINLSENPPSYTEVARIISGWVTGIARTGIRMPQHTDPNYQTRMQEAYTSVCDDIAIIAEDPGEKDVGTRLAYLHKQALPYEELIQVNGRKLNLLEGPAHIRAGWPAIVAG